MGSYLNPGSVLFRGSLRSKIYVDKSGLIEKTNDLICTEQKYVCVSRPRRFGKSMAANMLTAYYDREENTQNLFDKLLISQTESYKEHLNQYDVIRINMQQFLSITNSTDEMLELLQERILRELERKYPDCIKDGQLILSMMDIFSFTGHPFVILIDEWDCLFREYQQNRDAQMMKTL